MVNTAELGKNKEKRSIVRRNVGSKKKRLRTSGITKIPRGEKISVPRFNKKSKNSKNYIER